MANGGTISGGRQLRSVLSLLFQKRAKATYCTPFFGLEGATPGEARVDPRFRLPMMRPECLKEHSLKTAHPFVTEHAWDGRGFRSKSRAMHGR